MLKRYYKCFSRRFSSYWTYRFLLASSLLSSSPLSLSLFFFFFFLGGARAGCAPAWIRACFNRKFKIKKMESNDLAYEERRTTLGSVKLNHVIILSSCDLILSVQNGCAHVTKCCHYFTDSFCALWHALSEEFCIKDYFSKYGRHVEL